MPTDNEQLRKLQMAELDILKAFIEVCQKLGLRYYLMGGTLLGAVRHKGFIPWDDDIDVSMPRADYEVFLAQAQEHLPDSLFLQTYETDPGYTKGYAKIRNSETAFIETSVRKQNMNHGIFIDVFPLDIYDSSKKNNVFRYIKRILIGGRISLIYDKAIVNRTLWMIGLIAKCIYPTLKDACVARDKMFRRLSAGDVWINYLSAYVERENIPASWYGEGTKLLFEGLEVVVPAEYDKVLTQIFGDYMTLPPVEKRVTRHYTDVIDTEKSFREYL